MHILGTYVRVSTRPENQGNQGKRGKCDKNKNVRKKRSAVGKNKLCLTLETAIIDRLTISWKLKIKINEYLRNLESVSEFENLSWLVSLYVF